MKRIILLTIAAATLGFASCSDDAMSAGAAMKGYGKILFQSSASGMVATRAEVNVTNLGVTVPASGDFNLELTSPLLSQPVSGLTVAEFNAQSGETFYEKGDYTAVVTWGDPKEEGINKPYYYGTKTFTVEASKTNTATVVASIANSLAEVRTTERFDNFFSGAEFTLTTGAGKEFTFTPTAKATPATVFVEAGTSLAIAGSARTQSQNGVDEGIAVEFSSSLPATVARTRHIFTFDAEKAGSATLTVTIDENTTISQTFDVELNDYARK